MKWCTYDDKNDFQEDVHIKKVSHTTTTRIYVDPIPSFFQIDPGWQATIKLPSPGLFSLLTDAVYILESTATSFWGLP